MLFNINPANADKVKKSFIVEQNNHAHGYTASAILTAKNSRLNYNYEISKVCDIVVCTVRHKETDTLTAVVVFSSFTDDSIEIDKAELYRNCSNYPYRTEYNSRYLKKYDQIACIVHGAISAGLLIDAAEAPTAEETATGKEITTEGETTPQEGTESAQTAEGKTIQTGERLYSHPHRHMVTVDGIEDDLIRVICRGKLYLVSCADLYTDETETEPAQMETAGTDTTCTDEATHRATEDTQQTTARHSQSATGGSRDGNETTDGTTARNTTPPRHACENAPERTERGKAGQTTTPPHKRPPRGKMRATHARPPKFGKVYARIRVPSGALYFTGDG